MANYRRELKMGADIRRKEKIKKAIEFVKRMKKVQKKVKAALRKAQKEIKRQAKREQREVEEWKKNNKVMLSSKDLVFKERPVKKLTEQYVRPYIVVVRYRKPVKRQRVKEQKPVEVDGVKEWEVEKILNKRKIQGVVKYLVWQKEFTAENDTWKKEKNLENAKEAVAEFERRISTKVKRQEKFNLAEE